MNLSKLLKNFLIYLSSILGSNLLFIITSIFVARILGPKDYGLWVVLSFILIYGSYLHLGIYSALVKEIPFYQGKKDFQQTEEIKNTAFSSIFIISVCAGIVLFILSVILSHKYDRNSINALRLIAIILILQHIYDYLRYYLRAVNNFKAVGELRFVLKFLISILTIFFVVRFNFIGVPLAAMLGHILALFYIFKRYNVPIYFHINMKRNLSLIKIGFPIMAAGFIHILFRTIDRLLIFRYLGKISLGYYSIGCNISDFLFILPIALGIVLFTNLSREFGATGQASALKALVYGPTVLVAYAMPMVLGVVYLFFSIMIKKVMPQYIPGIDAGKLMIIGIFFLSLSYVSEQFLIAINKQFSYVLFLLFALMLKIIVSYTLIIKQTGIGGIAFGAVAVYFLFSIFIMIYCFIEYKEGFFSFIKYITKIYFPFAYSLLVLFCIHYFMHSIIAGTVNEVNRALISFLIFVIFAIVPLGYIFKKFLFKEGRDFKCILQP